MIFRSARSGRALHSAAVLALLCPAAVSAQQRQNGVVVGRVLSGDVAVPGATILVSGGRVTLARVDGRFRLSLPAGRYQVRAQRIGYTSGTDSVTIVAGDSAVANFRIERAASALEQVASVGTRGFERSVINGLAPVDIIDGARLRATGRTETSRALAAVAPSVAVSFGTAGEGSDLVRPVTLRGMGPDEVLVLVNGKRRHPSALVNTTTGRGRGSSGVDLDAIPASLIDHIEILHGDAVAQYGSDAIGGVINVVLKNGVHGIAASTVGATSTTFNAGTDGGAYPVGSSSANDGRTATASIDKGVVFGQRGFLHGGVELRDRGATNRALRDPAQATYAVTPYGDPRTHDAALFLNGGDLLGNGLEVYGNVGGSRRIVDAATAYVPSATPALLPVIRGTVDDYAGTFGVRGRGDDWRWDLSSGYGANKVGESVSPAISLSGAGTQAQADAGAQRLSQWTTALDVTREYSVFEELRFAAGAEFRRDAYRVDAAPVASGPAAYSGLIGFTPAQALDRSRRELGGYVDIETDVTNDLTIGLAGRTERYSTLDPQYAGKLSLRAEPVRNFVFRASVARGFRAPSWQQDALGRSYMTTSGIVELVPPLSASAISVGAAPLKAEHSLDYQAGVAVVLSPALSFTLDGYRSDLSDRVALSDVYSVASASGTPFHFFQNGVDTRTDGLDATLSYVTAVGDAASLRLTGGANVNHTAVRRVATTTVGGVTVPTVSVLEQIRLTEETPRDNLLGSALFTLRDFSAMLRTQRFGEVTGTGTTQLFTTPQTYGPRWVTDLNASYTLLRKYTFTVGADNLFDTYPQRMIFDPTRSTLQGITPYDLSSPFGVNGRFLYGRLSIYL